MKSLSSQLDQNSKEKERLSLCDDQLLNSQRQLKEAEEKLQQVTIDFNKTKAENKVLLKHDQVRIFLFVFLLVKNVHIFQILCIM